MSRKKKPLPILENVTIEAVAAEGKSLAHVNDMVVFVPFAVPGDVVDLQVRKKKHSYCEAEVIRFIKKSEVREEPMCQHFGICGGCKWQNLPYAEQLRPSSSRYTTSCVASVRYLCPSSARLWVRYISRSIATSLSSDAATSVGSHANR